MGVEQRKVERTGAVGGEAMAGQKRYLYAKPGVGAQGPCDEGQLRHLLSQGVITPDTQVTEEGADAWVPLSRLLESVAAAGHPPAALPPRLALFGNASAFLLSAAIIAGSCIIAL